LGNRSDLKPGQYVLESVKPQPAFARGISKEIRAYVPGRNCFTCQMRGAAAGEPHPYDPSRKTRLHIGHIVDKAWEVQMHRLIFAPFAVFVMRARPI
jgi:hypothetical protein